MGEYRSRQEREWERNDDRTVHFRSDGLALSPVEYTRLLFQLAEDEGIAVDEFSRGGVVARLEEAMAAILGRTFVLPDDVKRVAPAVLVHRLIVRPESRLRKVTAGAVV